MAEAATPGQPPVPLPPNARRSRHTRWFLIAFYTLALTWGAQSIYYRESSSADHLFPIALALALSWWAIVDASHRGHPLPLTARSSFLLGAVIPVPGYAIWSRGSRGVGWLVLHTVLWQAVAVGAMRVGELV